MADREELAQAVYDAVTNMNAAVAAARDAGLVARLIPRTGAGHHTDDVDEAEHFDAAVGFVYKDAKLDEARRWAGRKP